MGCAAGEAVAETEEHRGVTGEKRLLCGHGCGCFPTVT